VVKSGEKENLCPVRKFLFIISTTSNGANTSEVRFEEVGVKLDFAPIVLKDGFINLKIDPVEVSTIDPSTPTFCLRGNSRSSISVPPAPW